MTDYIHASLGAAVLLWMATATLVLLRTARRVVRIESTLVAITAQFERLLRRLRRKRTGAKPVRAKDWQDSEQLTERPSRRFTEWMR